MRKVTCASRHTLLLWRDWKRIQFRLRLCLFPKSENQGTRFLNSWINTLLKRIGCSMRLLWKKRWVSFLGIQDRPNPTSDFHFQPNMLRLDCPSAASQLFKGPHHKNWIPFPFSKTELDLIGNAAVSSVLSELFFPHTDREFLPFWPWWKPTLNECLLTYSHVTGVL